MKIFLLFFQHPDSDVILERDVFLYRSYLCQRKFGIVKEEIHAASSDKLQPLKKLANYLQVINKTFRKPRGFNDFRASD